MLPSKGTEDREAGGAAAETASRDPKALQGRETGRGADTRPAWAASALEVMPTRPAPEVEEE